MSRRSDRSRPAPLERPRAAGLLGGLAAFAVGFAVAGVLVVAGRGGTPPYLVCVTIGLLGIGVVGLFLNRGTVPLPEAPLWSRDGLAALTGPLGLPAAPVAAAFYALVAVGVLGNLVAPLSGR